MTLQVEITEESIRTFIEGQRELVDKDFQKWHDFVMSYKFLPPQPIPDVSNSAEFQAYQLNLWKIVSGRDGYDPVICESNDYISVVPNIQATYPFSSFNCAEVGNYFSGVGNIIRNLALPRGATIVEFGVGFSHLTRMLANMGFQVTAVDIEGRFLESIDDFPYRVPIQSKHAIPRLKLLNFRHSPSMRLYFLNASITALNTNV